MTGFPYCFKVVRAVEISCIFFLAFFASMSFAMPANAGSGTIYILLTSNGGGGNR